jgi:sugar phosphate isomerase/epimerase
MPISRFCDFARATGVDGIEILDAFLYAPGVSRDHLPETADFERELSESLQGLRVYAVAVTNDFAHSDPDRVRLEQDKIGLGVELAERYGSGLVRVFSAHPEPPNIETSRQRAIENLQQVDRRSRVLVLENHGVHFGTPSEVLAVASNYSYPVDFPLQMRQL